MRHQRKPRNELDVTVSRRGRSEPLFSPKDPRYGRLTQMKPPPGKPGRFKPPERNTSWQQQGNSCSVSMTRFGTEQMRTSRERSSTLISSSTLRWGRRRAGLKASSPICGSSTRHLRLLLQDRRDSRRRPAGCGADALFRTASRHTVRRHCNRAPDRLVRSGLLHNQWQRDHSPLGSRGHRFSQAPTRRKQRS